MISVQTPSRFDVRAIRWIAFDAVGTLIHPDPPVADVYHRVGVAAGSRLTVREVAARFSTAFARLDRGEVVLACECRDTADPLHTCEDRERVRWRQIVDDVLGLEQGGVAGTVSHDEVAAERAFAELFAHFGQPAAWRLFPEVPRTLSHLKKAGLSLAVCSNFDKRLHRVMDGLAALAPIELRVVSSEIGHRKPSPRFFEALLKSVGCNPENLLLVGDDRQNDVEAAQRAGIPALQIDRSADRGENPVLRSLDQLIPLLAP